MPASESFWNDGMGLMPASEVVLKRPGGLMPASPVVPERQGDPRSGVRERGDVGGPRRSATPSRP